ncbi:hypothetical protein GLP59_19030 [Sulfitobacter sp. M220]|uniref:hypothetical protein n=1 Tax=Sulfitobacter sp. M220 TaxID=2675333 RepID=UPI001F2AD3D6|nr:hypothetical protein [Sulfitobacter sp. M220]MCF7779681.1 hypothetical protein [Sulfitobacter sp. M220]
MDNRGGKRKGAGRPKGSTKKGTKLDEFNMMVRAQEYCEEMLEVLVDLARHSTSESTKLSAATQVLDRGHGRPGSVKMPDPHDKYKAFYLSIQRDYCTNNANLGAPFSGSYFRGQLAEPESEA